MSTQLLAFSGSLRAESFNTRLAFLAADLAESKGAVVTRLKLQDLNLPMFDEDSEAASGLPAGAKGLKDLMRAHDGFLIATPEYNGFMSGALKNAIDWATRPEEGHPPLDCFAGKTAGIMAASPGGLGGIRGDARAAGDARGSARGRGCGRGVLQASGSRRGPRAVRRVRCRVESSTAMSKFH